MWLWFQPNEEGGEDGGTCHVFVGFVEGMESGIRNPESRMRNLQLFQMSPVEAYCIVLYYFY